ncbi:hypothetical protein SSBR45G_43530 [Bradyrhizobium sp. SSBR45G]|uniref:hypothetical protein n=1 Tax=unclassified Bradyrhizobium TaxID=2631580 RepID=UPI002342AF8C|nr:MULTISPECIES: hypothetical protein [unclassified Bradyrhizobium]GLH79444.1 hypothetical protein SSBR45G_43530 [Bradyrhizobium sp. SSBR45G]GLH86821.1 hypothetical protein SSBR45R_42810 [Bradyrhizobium sp. SSBR45R]
MTIKHIIPGSLVALALLSGAAVAAELPSYEVGALPATPHQLSVVGASAAQQTIAADNATSPHQLAVLTHHRRSAALVIPTTVGSVRN